MKTNKIKEEIEMLHNEYINNNLDRMEEIDFETERLEFGEFCYQQATADFIKMIDEHSYCSICGNATVNGRCIQHPKAILLTNTEELKQMLVEK
ncbi:MAG: hypothetical protein EHM47_00815 [Ignavibacteriales bacterium]|nr:MAG: hypothetical protein EHM47_00815 [Ignavibacteriales bacterium]